MHSDAPLAAPQPPSDPPLPPPLLAAVSGARQARHVSLTWDPGRRRDNSEPFVSFTTLHSITARSQVKSALLQTAGEQVVQTAAGRAQ